MLSKSRLPAPPVPEKPHRRRTYYNLNPLRTLIFGHPVETEHVEHARLPKLLALPVFSSDAISSVAYATQQILLAFGAAGLATVAMSDLYSKLTLGVTAAIVLLLVIVVTSYWQTIFGYPSGGGSYIVSKANLGVTAGLIAGAALLIDYVLTVSVSIASGVQNLLATPIMADWLKLDESAANYSERYTHFLIAFCVVFIVILTLANLRGLKESGTMFALPTYYFVGMASLMIVLGTFGAHLGWHLFPETVNQTIPDVARNETQIQSLGRIGLVFLLLKAFANGCSAMTGVEAVSNGIPAFRSPQSRNAAMTLIMMACILGFLFAGISWLACQFHVVYWEAAGKTAMPVIDQLSGAVFGKPSPQNAVGGLRSFLYYSMQLSTTLILILAANTSYADFPRLSSIMAHDRFMPKPLANVGDKLVFSNGILLLGLFASALILLFKGSVDNLIPLYAVGVFTAFTLSQAGMVKHWFDERGPRWIMRAIVNSTGALVTFIVLLNILWEKRPETWNFEGFAHSAWIVVLVAAILFATFRTIHQHYELLSQKLSLNGTRRGSGLQHTVLILVPSLHRGILSALEYARSISQDCRGIHIGIEPDSNDPLKRDWEEYVGDDIPLVILESPFRSLTGPLVAYLDEVRKERDHLVTVIIPEFVSEKWWHSLLHNNSALMIKLALLNRPGVVVSNVRYFVGEERDVTQEAEPAKVMLAGAIE
jgi:amino acid transporter